jgi:hypothetical protein
MARCALLALRRDDHDFAEREERVAHRAEAWARHSVIVSKQDERLLHNAKLPRTTVSHGEDRTSRALFGCA